MKNLGSMSPEERKIAGPALNGLKDRIAASIEARRAALQEAGLEARLAQETIDVTLDGDTPLRMWLLRTHLRLIESAVVDNRADRASAADELGTTTSAERTPTAAATRC